MSKMKSLIRWRIYLCECKLYFNSLFWLIWQYLEFMKKLRRSYFSSFLTSRWCEWNYICHILCKWSWKEVYFCMRKSWERFIHYNYNLTMEYPTWFSRYACSDKDLMLIPLLTGMHSSFNFVSSNSTENGIWRLSTEYVEYDYHLPVIWDYVGYVLVCRFRIQNYKHKTKYITISFLV